MMRNLRIHRDNSSDEAGAILVLVLLFMVGIAILVGSLLTVTTTAQEATSAQNLAHSDVYAVDAGIEHGIERLRNPSDTSWCGTTTSDQITVNGATVTVRCSVISGSITKITNWAIISLDPNPYNGIQTSSGASSPIDVLGPTYVEGGMYLQSQLRIDAQCAGVNLPPGLGCTGPDGNGFIVQEASDCSTFTSGASTSPPNKGSKLPPIGKWSCTNQVPNVSPATPPLPGLPSVLPVATPSCTILYPGKYTASGTLPTLTSYPLPNLTGVHNVYMVSGDYYFDNVGTVDLGGSASSATKVVGGQPSAGESAGTTPGDATCTTTDPASSDGTGVEVILGGNSAINTNKGGMELFTREEPGSTVPQPSLITVPASPKPAGSLGQPDPWGASWDPSTLNGSGTVLTSASGIQPNVAIHGLLYAPDATVSLFATNSSVGEILGGLVAWDIVLQKSASASNFSIATTISPTIERSKLSATTQYGGKNLTATADVTVNITGSLTIGSWTVQNS